MADVCERIRSAVADGRRITVHGDYDVDGVCSTAILIRALRRLDADCDWLIPGRIEDGYGLTPAAIAKLAERGTGLLITVDCGINSVAEVAAAQAAGIDVIVTDHHQPGAQLPDAPILHPVVSGYPFAELCATAVAYKLAAALNGSEAVECELDLVALATVADLVPLRGENRSLVRRGLAEARRARRPGLRALMASAKVAPERLDEGDFAFRLAPRINAAGRLYRADAGVELMLSEDEERAAAIAAELERANHERREVEREVLAGAERALARAARGPRRRARSRPRRRGLASGGGRDRRLAARRAPLQAGCPGRARRARRRQGLWTKRPGVRPARRARRLRRASRPLRRTPRRRRGRARARRARGVPRVRSRPPPRARSRLRASPAPRRSTRSSAVRASDTRSPSSSAGWGRSGSATRESGCSCPGRESSDVRAMGEGDRHARFSLSSGSRRALGVAFSVDGALAAAASGGPLDVSVKLELNDWNGAVEPRVVLSELYAVPDSEPEADPGPHRIDADEFWMRLER